MSAITINLPDELAERLRKHQDQIAEILELGLREFTNTLFDEAAEIAGFLAGHPTPRQIIDIKASDKFRRRVDELIAKSDAGVMTPRDDEEWERYEEVEHMVTMAKIQAQKTLSAGASGSV